MKSLLSLLILLASFSATALEYRTEQVARVYGRGWTVNRTWMVPASEVAADAVIDLQNKKINKAQCEVKGVIRANPVLDNVLEYFVYDIRNCKET